MLFLWGVFQLATAIEPLASDRARQFLRRFTTNPFAGVLTGAVATTILDSSSVTIILVIALVNGGLLTFGQSLAVIVGSNIGTTVSSQILASDVEQYAQLVLLLGFVLFVAGRGSERWRHVGLAVITLASQGLLTLSAGLAIMLGAEIGTCADTLVAAIGRSRAAIRAGIFHLGFNLVTVAAGVLMIDQLAVLSGALPGGESLPRQIANAHVAFNLLGVAVFLPLIALIARFLERLLPDKPVEAQHSEAA